jgi:methionyl-tRNA synthetase
MSFPPMKPLLVTSALPYANGPIHIGHLVEYCQTDMWVRYWKLRGREAAYICADDTHGTPIMLRAAQEGIPPEQLIARVGLEHQRDFAAFHIEFDNYYTTHSPENRALATEIYAGLRRGGHIAEATVDQAYCLNCAMFLPDRYVRGSCPRCDAPDQYGDACEVCSSTYAPADLIHARCATCGEQPTRRASKHLFFRLSNLTDPLRAWLTGDHVQPEVRNKLEEWFAAGLQDWDISRDAPYFGFEIPGEEGKYFYVWLDAPVGYMASTLDWCRRTGTDFDTYWRRADAAEVCHFIGKDIIYFHALFWPAMLMGSGFRTPDHLYVHGFLTVGQAKMSKSRGTFITAETYLRHLDPQYLRYYYATKLSVGIDDIDLNLSDFVDRVNADLVNTFANIPSRLMAILHRSCDGRIGELDEAGRALLRELLGRVSRVSDAYERRDFAAVTRDTSQMVAEINVYVQQQEPWALAKRDVAAARRTCTSALNAFKIVAILLAPILPSAAASIARMLGMPRLSWDQLEIELTNRPVGQYERLFERVDPAKVAAMIDASKSPE